ncbi:hypothetical protein ACQZ6C_07960 [Rhizobium rhizogenes]
MSVIIHQFDPDQVSARGLFPDEIEKDPWVMFHGTSGFNAEAIERNGFAFQAGRDLPSPMDIQTLCDVYKAMKWVGNRTGGFAVLEPFSLQHDFLDDGKGLTFFGETSQWALLYATRDFAGGEKLRAIRIALQDLDLYLNLPDVREYHSEQMRRQFDALSKLNAHPIHLDKARPVHVDLDWLRNALVSLKDLRRLADSAHERHDHGVVYAIRLTPGDAKLLRYNNFMGIEASSPIAASRIVAKTIVPSDYEHNTDNGRGPHNPRNFGPLAATWGEKR